MSSPSPSPAPAAPTNRLALALKAFLDMESASGIILVAMMIIALAVMNSPLGPGYEHLLHVPVMVGVGDARLEMSLLHWINDGLMAVFFLVVALEIKREFLDGELSGKGRLMLPAVAALGGMAVPALVYLAFAGGDAVGARGWAIPSATDIAFSLGVLSVLGSRVPLALRVFLAALAIIDDLGAILVIAFFYSGDLAWGYLGIGAVAVGLLLGLNRMGVSRLLPYVLVGLVLWFCLLKSGVHATIGGVILGLCLPLRTPNGAEPLARVEHGLHPWVAYLILPVFALANSGLSFAGMGLSSLSEPVFLGVTLGLFLGKQVGVFSFSWVVIRLGLAPLPQGGWRALHGVAVLTGIGFTMSLFISGLAFGDQAQANTAARLGVLAGSVISALVGYVLIALARPASLSKDGDCA